MNTTKDSGGNPWPEWLPVAVNSLKKTDRLLTIVNSVHVLSVAILFGSAANLVFILHFSPYQQQFMFVFAISLFIPSLSLSIPSWIARGWFRKKRNAIIRSFYALGLMMDGRGRLVTNRPHAEVVHDPALSPAWLPVQ